MNTKIQTNADIEEVLISLKFQDPLPIVNEPEFSEMIELLAAHFNRLVTSDFNKLLSILYRIDVSEEKLKQELKAAKANESAGFTIARAVLDRIRQKQETRKKYAQQNSLK